jgi:nucleoside-diphosphate-sugar epimerase
MRVVVTGATGNVGTSLMRALAADDQVTELAGVARRRPEWTVPKATWVQADVEADGARLPELFAGADAVVHLAWLIQPSRDRAELRRVNVDGSRRVFEAAAVAGVGTLVHASSIGAYSRGPKDRRIDESHPTEGTPSSTYSVDKVAAERILDEVERDAPDLRVARLRPALIFKAEAGTEIRRYFAGPLLPSVLVRPEFLRLVPELPRLVVQAVHADDVAEAYRLVITTPDARGAFNVAAEPVLDPDVLARELRAVKVPVRARILRALADLTWRAHLQPTEPGWLDMGLTVPVMATARIRALGWAPRWTSVEALRELLDGMSRGRGLEGAPPLDPRTGGTARARELATGVGHRNP